MVNYLIEETFAGVPKSLLREYGVGDANGAIQRIVEKCRRADFLHVTPSQTVYGTCETSDQMASDEI